MVVGALLWAFMPLICYLKMEVLKTLLSDFFFFLVLILQCQEPALMGSCTNLPQGALSLVRVTWDELCMWRVGRVCRKIWTSLEAKCDLPASHWALSLHFSGQSRELKQKAADCPHLPSPWQGYCCVFHCRAWFAPWQVHVSTGGTPGCGSRTAWDRWMIHKSQIVPCQQKQQSEQWCCQSSAGWSEPPQGSPLSLGGRMRRRCKLQLGFHMVTWRPLPLHGVSQTAWQAKRWLLCLF